MASQDVPEIYDSYYFAHGCGRPYQRDDHWMQFFDEIAQRIIQDIQPETVLDAGCAMGFLVEGLRNADVEAWGVDISEYAIQQTHPKVQPYCWVGSVTEPFPRNYALIVCIEVLEHLPKSDSEKALNNLCQHTDDILFSSTPQDYKEATHFNVQPPEYWAELFARNGFFRDVDFDATFITPWATRFRRRSEPVPRLVKDYERKFWLLWKENADLRTGSVETTNQLSANDQTIQTLNAKVYHLTLKEQHLTQVLHSRSWRFMQNIQNLRLRLIPLESRRERWMNYLIQALNVLTNQGLRPLLRIVSRKARAREDYGAWLKRTAANPQELERQRDLSPTLAYRPLISFLTPVFNPPPQVLREMFNSVLAQTYDQWELCIADGNSDKAGVHAVLEEYSQRDSRIKIDYLANNLGISENTNIALNNASGEFVVLLDHDDVIAPNLLFEVVQKLNEDPATDIFYYDEDKLSADGKTRRDPLFKPAWSPEMLLSANYLTHPVIRKELVEEVKAFDPAMDGAQDWDLLLRCSEKTSRIRHIPQVLYHWRQISGSTAAQHTAKSWVFERQLNSVKNHMERLGIMDADAYFPKPGVLRVAWPTAGRRVSIIIPTKDKADYLKKCVNSILQTTEYPDYEIILVDNGSYEPETLDFYRTLADEPRVRIIQYLDKFNYSAANNLGAREATGELFLFLNNDIEVLEADWLEELVRWAERPDVGVVGARLVYPDDTIQHAGVVVGMQGHASHIFWGAHEGQGSIFGSLDWYRNYSAVTGACLMTRRELFEDITGFNEAYELAFSDIEFCVQIVRKGFRVVYTPFTRLRHYEGRSRGDYIPPADIITGYGHLADMVRDGDPYFNPNLSYAMRMPTLTRPDEETRTERLERILKDNLGQ
jgi:GT2 family glycosyltransferase